tara:strand:- start:1419 stop:1778 length:360 start_codon:yes stop_codon:yes gene_type:complete
MPNTNHDGLELRICPECGEHFATSHHSKLHCSTKCRKAWNNRRMTRGAELYDAFMALRYDRGWAKTVGLWQLICRLVAEWRAEDNEKGRESYIRPDRWYEENRAWLRSANLGNVNCGRK